MRQQERSVIASSLSKRAWPQDLATQLRGGPDGPQGNRQVRHIGVEGPVQAPLGQEVVHGPIDGEVLCKG